jgi:hypothetical protein
MVVFFAIVSPCGGDTEMVLSGLAVDWDLATTARVAAA